MTANPDVDDVLRRYLLGNVTPEVREGVEARLFSDDAIFWEHLCLVEDELIDDYVGRDLDGKDLENFERCFLSTEERRRKLQFAQALKVHLQRHESNRGSSVWSGLRRQILAPAWAVATAAVLLLVAVPGAVWQFASSRAQRDEVSVWLAAGLVRGASGEMKRVQIPAGCKLVRFHIESDGTEYKSYRASFSQVAGDEIWSQANLNAGTIDGKVAVTVTLPSDLLAAGDYYLRLQGVSQRQELIVLNRYDFRVLRQ